MGQCTIFCIFLINTLSLRGGNWSSIGRAEGVFVIMIAMIGMHINGWGCFLWIFCFFSWSGADVGLVILRHESRERFTYKGYYIQWRMEWFECFFCSKLKLCKFIRLKRRDKSRNKCPTLLFLSTFIIYLPVLEQLFGTNTRANLCFFLFRIRYPLFQSILHMPQMFQIYCWISVALLKSQNKLEWQWIRAVSHSRKKNWHNS